MTKNEKYIVEMYVRYFGKAADTATIAKYSEFTKASKILAEIREDADIAKSNMTTAEFVNNAFNNLFGRDATTKEMNKYSKVIDAGKDLPISAIVKAAKKADKSVYNNKKAVAEFVAEKGAAGTVDLSKIASGHLITLPLTTIADLQAKIDELPVNNGVPSADAGKTFSLTAGSDTTFVSTDKSDTFNAYDVETFTGAKNTLTGVDALNGGAGKDILNIKTDLGITPVLATVSNIEIINLESGKAVTAAADGAEGITFDTTTYTGVETLNATKGTSADLTAAATTDVNVSGITGTVEVNGGKNVVVTDAKAAVVLDNAKGNVTVTDATQDSAITINDGVNVTVTATTTGTATVASSGNITIGGTNTIDGPDVNTGNATGDVVVTANLNSDGETDLAGGDITVTGGKTVTVTTNSTIVSTTADADATDANAEIITNGAINITGDANTTTVTVKQTESVTDFTKAAVAAVKATQTVTFKALEKGDTVTVNGLTFTASKDLLATEVAAAFADLSTDDTQDNGGITANGYYTNSFTTVDGWTSAAANGATVTFTAPAFNTTTDLVVSSTNFDGETTIDSSLPTAATIVAGTAAKDAEYSYDSVNFGKVTIDNNTTTDVLKTVSVDGYGASSTISSNALTTVTLKNSAGDMTVISTVASLNVTVDDVQDAVTLTDASLKTLNLTTTGVASDFALSAEAVETLTIAAGADLDVSSHTLTALKTVTITGTGDVALGDISTTATALTSTSTGDISAQIDGTKATVTTGAGNDTITVDTTTVAKAITLGAGNDKLTLTALTGVDADTAAIAGGEGTDTIFVTAAVAAAASSSIENSNLFKSKVTGFEQLEVTTASVDNASNAAAADVVTINLENLGFNYVITNGTVAGGALLTLDDNQDKLILDKIANNATVVLNAAGLVTVNVKDAATVVADTLNVVIGDNLSDINTLTVADVAKIAITTTNTFVDETSVDGSKDKYGHDIADGKDDTGSLAQLSLIAAAAKTVTVTGAGDLTLDAGSSIAAVTLIDAATMTGDLVVVSQNVTSASTIKGGAGDDTLTASTTGNTSVIDQVNTLIGGAGNDTLTANNGKSILTGGEGSDTFVINTASYTVDYASTITDLGSGDIIKFTGATSFAKLTDTPDLDGTPNLAAFANAAINEIGVDSMAWFQYNNNTYIVMDKDTLPADNAATFTNGEDFIVKIAGLKTLDTGASFNVTTHTLEIA